MEDWTILEFACPRNGEGLSTSHGNDFEVNFDLKDVCLIMLPDLIYPAFMSNWY